MAVTYGFYNSVNGDRRYDALQMSSIFDGIILDGVFQHYAERLMVHAATGMTVNVHPGRAWFNHTWTLNDSVLPLTIPQSELILDRIDSVVLEVDARDAVRKNTIKVVRGTPSSNPQRTPPIRMQDLNQYPLAYVYVKAKASAITQANITNNVGMSTCPYVTGPLKLMNIDELIAQWQAQWNERLNSWTTQWTKYYHDTTTSMDEYMAFWRREWEKFYVNQCNAIQNSYNAWINEWNAYYRQLTTDLDNASDEFKERWETWFRTYTNSSTNAYSTWEEAAHARFEEWFASLQDTLSGDVAANLAAQIMELQKCCQGVQQFIKDLREEHSIYYQILDTGYRDKQNVLDNTGDDVLDSEDDPINSMTISHDPICDSNGDPLIGRIKFKVA